MSNIYTLIRHKAKTWIAEQKESPQSITFPILQQIEKQNKLRLPQKEAIENYLWLKFEAQNKNLFEVIQQGKLLEKETSEGYKYQHIFSKNPVTAFLNIFSQEHKLKKLQASLLEQPLDNKWDDFLKQLLHNFDYPNYLFSLPMGAGKTFLMASFIYLDLYFANLLGKKDLRFAHNFVVFAPHASKTAILPSLKTIKNFSVEWILPKEDARKIKQLVNIEILDSLSSARKDKLQGQNPNLEIVKRQRQQQNFGMVFITNAEKVVLEKYEQRDLVLVQDLQKNPKGNFFNDRKSHEIEKTNELRKELATIPNLMVLLDEVHHSYNQTIKLREAVEILNQKEQPINSVIGFSGTPYVRSKIDIGGESIKLNQIQDIVYNYPLNLGIGKFLKTPVIKKADVSEDDFLKQALRDFFENYNITYKYKGKSKIAFYCPSIKTLNEQILPVIKDWYQTNRAGKEQEIFCYYSTAQEKKYQLPKENASIFQNLDAPYNEKRVILLVAIGKEGWDCHSLTSVVLPRQKTAKNFVLQTTCRCLREVTNAKTEKALIYLSPDNYDTLNQELRETYHLSITDLTNPQNTNIELQVRKPKLGKLRYNQVEIRYAIASTQKPDIKKELADFSLETFKKDSPYNPDITSAKIGKKGLTSQKNIGLVSLAENKIFSFIDFIYALGEKFYGITSEAELCQNYEPELQTIYQQINKNKDWIELHPRLNLTDIINEIALVFFDSIEYKKEELEQETEIELLEWTSSNEKIAFYAPDGKTIYKFLPKIKGDDFTGKSGYARKPEGLAADFFSDEHNIDPNDISFNYMPYRMDSEFEIKALEAMVKLAELENLEVYFNGYKDGRLQSFWIQTPNGKYTPDFLILKRADNQKYQRAKKKQVRIEKALILETKGGIYNTDEFQTKEKFINETFLPHNKSFCYHCFIGKEGNNFTDAHLQDLKSILTKLK